MKENFSVGDVVISVAGRDKGKAFLIIEVKDNYVYLVNGRTRKVINPKRKKEKHLKMVSVAGAKELAMKITIGEPVSNEKVYKAIKTEKEKIQED